MPSGSFSVKSAASAVSIRCCGGVADAGGVLEGVGGAWEAMLWVGLFLSVGEGVGGAWESRREPLSLTLPFSPYVRVCVGLPLGVIVSLGGGPSTVGGDEGE